MSGHQTGPAALAAAAALGVALAAYRAAEDHLVAAACADACAVAYGDLAAALGDDAAERRAYARTTAQRWAEVALAHHIDAARLAEPSGERDA